MQDALQFLSSFVLQKRVAENPLKNRHVQMEGNFLKIHGTTPASAAGF